MCARGWASVLALLLALAAPARAGLPDNARPVTAACAVTTAPPASIDAVFAYDLTSPAILHFLTALKNVAPADQRRIVDRAASDAGSPAETDLAAAEAAVCPNLDEFYGTTRGLTFVLNEWRGSGLDDHARFERFATVFAQTITALSLGTDLDAAARRAALDAFAGLPADEPAAAANCAQPNAAPAAVHSVAPPDLASAGQPETIGLVDVRVRVDADGNVRSALYAGDTLGGNPGASAAIRAAIFAAAASTYRPQIKDCRPVGGDYTFVAAFGHATPPTAGKLR